MNRVLGVVALALEGALVLAAFVWPVLGFADADAPQAIIDQVRAAADQSTDFERVLFTQVRQAEDQGPEGIAGMVSYRTIFGLEVQRVAVRGATTESLVTRTWSAVWAWIAFIGAEVGLLSFAIWRLTLQPGSAPGQPPPPLGHTGAKVE